MRKWNCMTQLHYQDSVLNGDACSSAQTWDMNPVSLGGYETKRRKKYIMHSADSKQNFTASIYGSTALCWALAAFSVSWSFCTVGRTPWTRDQPVARPLPAHRTAHKHRINTDIHALSGIRTHNLGVRASKNSSCLRQHGHCDRPSQCLFNENEVEGGTCRA
jgi:hypothetical protein